MEKRLHELSRVELAEILNRLPNANETNGESKLMTDRDHYAPLCAAVELGEHHPGNVSGLLE